MTVHIALEIVKKTFFLLTIPLRRDSMSMRTVLIMICDLKIFHAKATDFLFLILNLIWVQIGSSDLKYLNWQYFYLMGFSTFLAFFYIQFISISSTFTVARLKILCTFWCITLKFCISSITMSMSIFKEIWFGIFLKTYSIRTVRYSLESERWWVLTIFISVGHNFAYSQSLNLGQITQVLP